MAHSRPLPLRNALLERPSVLRVHDVARLNDEQHLLENREAVGTRQRAVQSGDVPMVVHTWFNFRVRGFPVVRKLQP